MTYTCADYRSEMILAGLKKRLCDPSLSKEERKEVQKQIETLEKEMGLE
ncbi:MAG: hypothetical protein JEZ11_02470 [Desulfobacterales bacterium]|nr:hypothetical protein [Desulfobacterales bacterium]